VPGTDVGRRQTRFGKPQRGGTGYDGGPRYRSGCVTRRRGHAPGGGVATQRSFGRWAGRRWYGYASGWAAGVRPCSCWAVGGGAAGRGQYPGGYCGG
jgi:hypothetical protein